MTQRCSLDRVSSKCGTAVVTLLSLVAFVVRGRVNYRSTTQFIKEPDAVKVHNHNIEDLDDMTFLLPDHKQAALTSHMISQGSTVTVVLLTFEALVVAFVPVVVATYPSGHLHHKEDKVVEQRRLYGARIGDFQIRQSSSHTHIHPSIRTSAKSTPPQWSCSHLLSRQSRSW